MHAEEQMECAKSTRRSDICADSADTTNVFLSAWHRIVSSYFYQHILRNYKIIIINITLTENFFPLHFLIHGYFSYAFLAIRPIVPLDCAMNKKRRIISMVFFYLLLVWRFKLLWEINLVIVINVCQIGTILCNVIQNCFIN